MKHSRVYHMLCVHGHIPEKALEIIVDARRGDKWSLRWIRRARAMTHNSQWIRRKHDAPLIELAKMVGHGAVYG